MKKKMLAFALACGALALALVLGVMTACKGSDTDDRDTGSGDSDTDADSGTDTDTDGDSDADSGTDTEPGCGLNAIETFDAAIPTGWTSTDGGSGAGSWQWFSGTMDWNGSFEVDGGLVIDSDAAGLHNIQDDDIESPLYALGSCTSALVSFDHFFQERGSYDDLGEVYVIPGGTGTPYLVTTFSDDTTAGALSSFEFPVAPADLGGQTSFSVQFHYEGSYSWGWYVDNFAVTGVI
jgi:hypothetical protein